jgi:hypothetical protein
MYILSGRADGLASQGLAGAGAPESRPAKARAAVDQNDPRYLQAINRAFAVLIE